VSLNDLSYMGNLLGEGFFADNVITILGAEKDVGPKESKILNRITSFMNKIKRGKQQVDTGQLDSEAVESIGAYYKAIITFQALTQKIEVAEDQNFKKLVEQINEEVRISLANNKIEPMKLENTIGFFKAIQRETLIETSRYCTKESEVFSWSKKIL